MQEDVGVKAAMQVSPLRLVVVVHRHPRLDPAAFSTQKYARGPRDVEIFTRAPITCVRKRKSVTASKTPNALLTTTTIASDGIPEIITSFYRAALRKPQCLKND